MDKEVFYLSPVNNNKFIKVVEVVFGSVCIMLAAYWLIFNINSAAARTLWITILFLAAFGFYMIWAGIGKAARFVEVQKNSLSIKNTVFFPVIKLLPAEIEKFELYPFKIQVFLKTGKHVLIRLSSSYYETNGKIIDAVLRFAEDNDIRIEEIEENI